MRTAAAAQKTVDVVVVGAGNAAFCAALRARQQGASVVMVEVAPREQSGGNSRFTAGAMRFAYEGVDEIRRLCPELSAQQLATTDFGSYPTARFYDDMFEVTEYRTDPALCEALVTQSYATMCWLREQGVRFAPIYGRQAFEVDGRFVFWGGLTLEVCGGGVGLVDAHTAAAHACGVEMLYETRAQHLLFDGCAVHGIRARCGGEIIDIHARAVVLACGGFEANAEWRARYLGPGWEMARTRGSCYNTGDGIGMALAIGASAHGNWSGCHAVGWDYNAPEFGDLTVGDGFQKHSYPWGIMVNANGRRFVDEGADFRNYTYAKYGREILNQPRQFAWQVFDQQVAHLLRDEYRIKRVTRVRADSLIQLADKLDGVNRDEFLREVDEYNRAVQTQIAFNPTVKDGRCTRGLALNKSNWANTIERPPFEAYQVGCGITFTFGGLRIDADSAQVLDSGLQPIAGLFAAGELVGGIFYFNYPGGAGLTAGAVFGRIAGEHAAG